MEAWELERLSSCGLGPSQMRRRVTRNEDGKRRWESEGDSRWVDAFDEEGERDRVEVEMERIRHAPWEDGEHGSRPQTTTQGYIITGKYIKVPNDRK